MWILRWMAYRVLRPFGGGITADGGYVCAELSVTPAVGGSLDVTPSVAGTLTMEEC